MQIDFHHAVTYIVARLAGFDRVEANTIASAAQYVDDAVWDGAVNFENRFAYQYTSSAHKMLDYKNFRDLANHKVWIPFHFFPGNHYDPAYPHTDEFIQRLTCRPNSELAQEMMAMVRQNMGRKHSLHLLGIACHVYIDTWAHQGFVGIMHDCNEVEEIFGVDGLHDHRMMEKKKKFFSRHKRHKKLKAPFRYLLRKLKIKFLSGFVSELSPLGHGGVLSYPDLPYLKWSYLNSFGERIVRDNPKDFLAATENLFLQLQKVRNPDATGGMKAEDRRQIERLIMELQFEDPLLRHRLWCDEVAKGAFSFGAETLRYEQEGESSWYYKVFQNIEPDELPETVIPWNQEFMESDWKKMHDAIFCFRTLVMADLLPHFNICVI